MNSSFQLLKGETDGEKINLPSWRKTISPRKICLITFRRKKTKGLTRSGEQPILLTWSVSKWCNTASFVDAAINSSILYISECALAYIKKSVAVCVLSILDLFQEQNFNE